MSSPSLPKLAGWKCGSSFPDGECSRSFPRIGDSGWTLTPTPGMVCWERQLPMIVFNLFASCKYYLLTINQASTEGGSTVCILCQGVTKKLNSTGATNIFSCRTNECLSLVVWKKTLVHFSLTSCLRGHKKFDFLFASQLFLLREFLFYIDPYMGRSIVSFISKTLNIVFYY